MRNHIIAAIASVFLIACSNDKGDAFTSPVSIPVVGISGTYVSEDGKHKLTFSSGNKVSTTQFGKDLETTYTVEGKTIKFKFSGGLPITCTVNSDDSITSMTGTRYVKT